MSKLEKHLISSRACVPLADDYDRTIYAEINKNRPAAKPESKHYTIELEVLQDYLKMVSDEMDKKGIINKGIRFNLGKYPEKSDDPRLDPDFLGYQMVFVSPVELQNMSKLTTESQPDDSQSKSCDDLPNLNYMNISPPK